MNPRDLSTCSKLSQLHPLSSRTISVRHRNFRLRCPRRSQIVAREGENETRERKRGTETGNWISLYLERWYWKERKKNDILRLQPPHSLVFNVDRINCYDRYQHIRNIQNSLSRRHFLSFLDRHVGLRFFSPRGRGFLIFPESANWYGSIYYIKNKSFL